MEKRQFNHLWKKQNEKNEKSNVIPLAVFEKDHSGKTPIPKHLLEELIECLGYRLEKNSGPDGKSDHTTVNGMEKTLFLLLGSDMFGWEQIISSKYKNEKLGRKIYQCFRPILPFDMYWLHPNAIADALSVYEQDEKISFACYGPSSADYEFLKKDFKKTANHYAFIFNTKKIDIHSDFRGSHWVVLYIDLFENQIDYYDSFGGTPNAMLQHSIKTIIKVLQIDHPQLTTTVNFTNNQHQRKTTECGVYVVHFVVQRLYGKSFKEFTRMFLPDEIMKQYREKYWTVLQPEFNYIS